MKLQIAVLQIGQARMIADQPGANFVAGQKDRCGRAVIGPFARVFGDAPTEFAERQNGDAIAVSVVLDVLHK